MTKIKPRFFSDTKFLEIAKKYNKSAAQLALRYLVRIIFLNSVKFLAMSFHLNNLILFKFYVIIVGKP